LSVVADAAHAGNNASKAGGGPQRWLGACNVAKRKQVAALSALISEFENGERLLAEALIIVEGLSGRSGSA